MCGSLNDINNGKVDITGSVYNSTATYSCVEGYQLDGDMQRTCLSTGAWSGSEPECSCKCMRCMLNGMSRMCTTIVVYACFGHMLQPNKLLRQLN